MGPPDTMAAVIRVIPNASNTTGTITFVSSGVDTTVGYSGLSYYAIYQRNGTSYIQRYDQNSMLVDDESIIDITMSGEYVQFQFRFSFIDGNQFEIISTLNWFSLLSRAVPM